MEEATMSCSRCNGHMIEDHLLDMEDSSGPMWLQAWRCMNCGNVFDHILHQNRLTHDAKLHPSSISATGMDGAVKHTSAAKLTRLVA